MSAVRRYTRATGPFPAACLRGHFPAVLRRRVFSQRRALSVHGCGGYFSRSKHLFSFPMPVYPLKNKNELCPNQKGSTSAGIGENGPHRADTCTDCSINRPALQWVRTGFRPLWAKRDAEHRFFDGGEGNPAPAQSQTSLRPHSVPPFSRCRRAKIRSPPRPGGAENSPQTLPPPEWENRIRCQTGRNRANSRKSKKNGLSCRNFTPFCYTNEPCNSIMTGNRMFDPASVRAYAAREKGVGIWRRQI